MLIEPMPILNYSILKSVLQIAIKLFRLIKNTLNLIIAKLKPCNTNKIIKRQWKLFKLFWIKNQIILIFYNLRKYYKKK